LKKSKRLRTQDLNPIIHTIATLSDNYKQNKKGITNVKIDKSPFAEKTPENANLLLEKIKEFIEVMDSIKEGEKDC
jgi:hypothetical protein